MMAKRSKRGGTAVRVIEKSLSDAQKVLAGYISSGSDQMTDTMRAVRRIFDNRQLASALKKARAARMAVAGVVSGRGGTKKRKATSSRRKLKARRSPAKRSVKTRRTTGRRAQK
jgi:hypothetical protein